MPIWLDISFQDGLSPLMDLLIFFHDHSIIFLILITILSIYYIFYSFFLFGVERYLLESHYLELIWTLIPGLVLVFIALPSLIVLYITEEFFKSSFDLKIIGHQWFWSYELLGLSFYDVNSYMLHRRSFRLLDCDNRLILCFNICFKLLISSEDVIHSWTIPSLGLKVDAVPGRLNQLNLFSKRSGIFFGQCSEICGANHSFMPIIICVIPRLRFLQGWI